MSTEHEKIIRTGGQKLIKALHDHEVDTIFCVAGESYLAALDALVDYPDIRVVTCRQEGGAVFMAESYAKQSGKVGICFVTRGPGACNASIGVHTAKQDSTPLILLVGQVARDQAGKEAFQEIDYNKMFGSVAKWTDSIDDVKDVEEKVYKAFDMAMNGRMGPAVLALPEDVLREEGVSSLQNKAVTRDVLPPQDDVARAKEMLAQAQRPILIIGGSGYDNADCYALEAWAADHDVPVITSFRRQDLFSHDHDCYAGELGTGPNPALVQKVKEADLIIALGTRLGEIASQGYALFQDAQQKLIHVYPDPEEFGKVYNADLSVLSSGKAFIHALAGAGGLDASQLRKDWCCMLRNHYEAWNTITLDDRYDFDLNKAFQAICSHMPEPATITTDAGNFSGWAQRFIRYGRGVRLLAPTSGAMGYGLPSIIGGSLANPEAKVIGLMGDGGFMMCGQELATIKGLQERGIRVNGIALVFDNGIYGTIRMHQERDYPGRPIATDLHNPDFYQLAKSYGLHAVQVCNDDDFEGIFTDSLNRKEFTLIHVKTDQNQITTVKSMAELSS